MKPSPSHARRTATLAAALGALLVTATAPVAARSPQAAARFTATQESVEIRRDHYGMPHVYAKTTFGLFHGYGYVVAQDRLFQMEMARRSTQGRVAEVLGPKFVAFDKGIRANYWPQSIHDQIAALPRADRDILEGYAAGMNAWLARVKADPGRLMPKQFNDLGFAPEPWTAFDVVMVFVGTMANRFSDFNTEIDNLGLLTALTDKHGAAAGRTIFDELKWVIDPDAPTTVPESAGRYTVPVSTAGTIAHTLPDYRDTPPSLARLARHVDGALLGGPQEAQHEALLAQLEAFGMTGQAGFPAASNIWIVGKKRAAGASSILLNGPQFGWFAPAYTFGIGLHGAGFDIVGNTPFAYPCILFGHNGRIGWGATAGFGDGVDIFAEKLDPADPTRYLHKGEWKQMETRSETIAVKGAAAETLEVHRTVHGLVVKSDPKAGVAYAKARTWSGRELDSLFGWVRQGQATDWKGWLGQAERNALTINWYYADRRGNIGYVHTGKYPERRAGHDLRLPVPGTGEMDWKGLLPFRSNPQVYNPDTGYLVNWNNSPMKGYPNPDMLWLSWGGADRLNELEQRLAAQPRLDADAMWALLKPTSLADVNVRYFLPALEKAVAGLPDDDRRRQMVRLLAGWDRMHDDANRDGRYDSPASAIMPAWFAAMLRATVAADLPADFAKFYLSAGYPTAEAPPAGSINVQPGVKVLHRIVRAEQKNEALSHDFLKGRSFSEASLQALAEADAALTQCYGADMAGWLAPVAKNKFFASNFFGVPQAGDAEARFSHVAMNRGTENNMTALGEREVRSWDVAAPGQDGFVAPDGSTGPHYLDQMELYDQYKHKPVLGTRKEIVKGTTRIEHLTLPRR